MQSNPEDLDLDELESELRLMNNEVDVHDIHAWSLDGKYHMFSLHVVISQIPDHETRVQLKNQIREQTREMGIDHATIEIELPSKAFVLENC